MVTAFKVLAVKIDEMTAPSDTFVISCDFAKRLEDERNELLSALKDILADCTFEKRSGVTRNVNEYRTCANLVINKIEAA